jgi:hypothetical protein
MKNVIIGGILIVLFSCVDKKVTSVELNIPANQKESLYKDLTSLATAESALQKDSLAFLVLPLEASCPACRDKTIDSILKHKDNLLSNHFIILSGKLGWKSMNAYFRKQEGLLPVMPGRVFIDSTDRAGQYSLYKNNPAIYYAANQKVYKKVLALPFTVKQDLQEFFSGRRENN